MPDEARIYQCPTCGGPTSEAERRCEYCRAPVATQRCVRCFHMNVAESRHCTGCGNDLAAPSPSLEGSEFSCPGCKVGLDAVELERGSLFDCANCGGQFAPHELLHALLEQRARLPHGSGPKPRPENPLNQRVVYRACPACRVLMNRRNFGGTSGVIVDICARHGLWFDRGELPRVLAFVERGGLERERATIAENARQERAATRLATLKSDGEEFPPLDLGGAARELLELVIDVVRGRSSLR